MKDNFKIITKIKRMIIYIDKIIVNFPANEKVLKDKITSSMYDILELTYLANEINNDKRILYKKKIITKFKMVDFYFKIACDKKYISYKKYIKIGNHLLEIIKQVYGWIKYEKNQKFI